MATDKKTNRRGGIDRDGIYRRRSLVTIERDALGGDLYDKQAMADILANAPGFLGRDRKDLLEYHFVVTTRRYGSGGEWEVVVHFPDGEDRTIPEPVLTAMRRHYDSIIKAQARDNAANRPRPARKAAVAEEDNCLCGCGCEFCGEEHDGTPCDGCDCHNDDSEVE